MEAPWRSPWAALRLGTEVVLTEAAALEEHGRGALGTDLLALHSLLADILQLSLCLLQLLGEGEVKVFQGGPEEKFPLLDPVEFLLHLSREGDVHETGEMLLQKLFYHHAQV